MGGGGQAARLLRRRGLGAPQGRHSGGQGRARGKGLRPPSPPQRRQQPRTGGTSPVTSRSPQRQPAPPPPRPGAAALPQPLTYRTLPRAPRRGRTGRAGPGPPMPLPGASPTPTPEPPACSAYPRHPARQRRTTTPASSPSPLEGPRAAGARNGRRARQSGSCEARGPASYPAPGCAGSCSFAWRGRGLTAAPSWRPGGQWHLGYIRRAGVSRSGRFS